MKLISVNANKRKYRARVRTVIRFCLTLAFIGFVCAWVSAPGVVNAAQGDNDIAFRWAFGAIDSKELNPKLEAITGDRMLKTGDRLKMMVELQKECYVYVIYYGPQDQVKLLFPYTLSHLASDYQINKRYYIPQGPAWFELDQNVGTEAFHVVASAQRLKGLETVLSQYDNVEAGQKPEVAKRVLSEIRSLRKQGRELTTAAERPISIGGNVRSMEKMKGGVEEPDVSSIAQEIAAKGSYYRTFTIEHR